jgi:eukaryotic-like serine/threonine-protein kinase
MSNETNPDDTSAVSDEVDPGLACAHGEDSVESATPSVIGRIGEITGSASMVLLRDDQAGDTPMLKPLGPDGTREAGKYVVHGELGRGGVGTVHRGHDQDLGRDVAMKFLHDKFKDEPSILHRFVEEAQIGGQLQHPGIVPVYDLGMVDGKPFFSMKLVKGQTLAKKLAERGSPSDDRREFLSIFEDVCQTLAYAHARGVVHRDLKPANIMIGSFGEVQVVDWGMGKVLASGGVADEKLAAERQAEFSVIQTVRSDGHGSQSVVGSIMGTLAYMPPEQARGDVEAMDERSDVFALGAILCEILAGKPPYVGEPAEMIGMAAMASLDDAYARLEATGSEPEMVELATRCLMPAPAARPKSAEVVAKAVHDHLAAVESRVHEARVEAAEAKVRAASLKRMQKLGISLTVVIAAGLLVSLWFWRAADTAATNEGVARAEAVASAGEAQENEQLAVEQTEVAERELARAVEIKTLIFEMLQSVNPEQAKGADITLLKGILDTASKRLAEGAIEDELVAAELHALIGNVYCSIGLYPEAELHLPVALEFRKRLLGDEHGGTLTVINDLAVLYHRQGRYSEAESLYLQTLEIRKRVLDEEHPATLRSMANLASLYDLQGRYAEAEPLYLRALEIMKRVLGEEHASTLGNMNNLAGLYEGQGRYAEAEPLYLQALEIKKRVLGEEHPSTLSSMNGLASLYGNQGRYAGAEPLYLQTLEIQKRVLGEEHPDTLRTMNNLAGNYMYQDRHAEAEPLRLQTLKIQKRVLGEEHPSTLGTMADLATNYSGQGRYAEAETLYLQTLEIMKRVLGLQHPWTGYAMRGLVTAYLGMGRSEDALPLRRELLGLKVAPAEAVDANATVLNGAAWTLLTVEDESLRDPERALGFAERACALAKESDSARLWTYLDTLALAQHDTGDTDVAIETQKRAIALMPEGADPSLAERLAEYEAAVKDR